MKALVLYYSRTGVTKQMAEEIAATLKKEKIPTDLFEVEGFAPKELLNYDGIIVGSPTYYGTLAWQVKKLFEESVAFHGRLDHKIGGAFTSSANLAGGNETTLFSILQAMLIHGMIVQGDPEGDHYGPVSLGSDTDAAERKCRRFAERFAALLKKTRGV